MPTIYTGSPQPATGSGGKNPLMVIGIVILAVAVLALLAIKTFNRAGAVNEAQVQAEVETATKKAEAAGPVAPPTSANEPQTGVGLPGNKRM